MSNGSSLAGTVASLVLKHYAASANESTGGNCETSLKKFRTLSKGMKSNFQSERIIKEKDMLKQECNN